MKSTALFVAWNHAAVCGHYPCRQSRSLPSGHIQLLRSAGLLLDRRQWRGDAFEAPPLGPHADYQLHQRCHDHEARGDEVADKEGPAVTCADQLPEDYGRKNGSYYKKQNDASYRRYLLTLTIPH